MTRIVFSDLKIGKVSDSSGVFTGENVQSNQRSNQEVNEGFGSISGDRAEIKYSVNVLNDQDLKSSKRNNSAPKEV